MECHFLEKDVFPGGFTKTKPPYTQQPLTTTDLMGASSNLGEVLRSLVLGKSCANKHSHSGLIRTLAMSFPETICF